MAFLDSADHDVFVSYAHIDNIPDIEGEKGWVERFSRQLATRLLKRFGETVEVWRDPELARSQAFDKVIEKAVLGSGLMISLISERYLKSDYCMQEIDWFTAKVDNEPPVDDDYRRIFPVLLYNIQPDRWPQAAKGTLAFPFHDAEHDEHGNPLDPDSDHFGDRLGELVEEIYAVLSRMKTPAAARIAPALAAAAPGEAIPVATLAPEAEAFSVFLSVPPEDLKPRHRQLRADLERNGIRVISDIPPPYDEAGHSAAVAQAIEAADLSVHLLSDRPGEPLDEGRPHDTFTVLQARMGLDAKKPQLVLTPAEFDPLNIDAAVHGPYLEFVRSLESLPREAERFELIRAGRRQMLEEVLAKRAKLERARERTQQVPVLKIGTAFIDLHTTDVPFASDLVGYLAQKQVTPIMIPSADLAPTTGMNLFRDNLKKAGLFIVVFGQVTRAWVVNRLEEAFKLILEDGLSTRIAVYVAPPHKSDDVLRFPPMFQVASNMDGFHPGSLDRLLDLAGGAGA